MSLPLANKIAIVTGASRGIGAGVAERLAADGATVVVNYNSSKGPADELVQRINSNGKGSAIAIKANMASLEEGRRLVEDTVKEFGRLDILVLNAALVIDGTLDIITEEQFTSHFDLNVKVPLFMVQAASKYMKAGGRVIFFSTSQTKASLVRPPYLLYTASKGAVEQIMRVLAKDLGARNITVNTIAPSATETDMYRNAIARSPNPHLATEMANLHPQKRIGRVDEISPVAAFLATDEASWVNGQIIYVTGGYVV